MDWRSLLILIVLAAMAAFASVGLAQDEGESPHWEYEGDAGPENWGNLHPDYDVCGTGDAQSPINIVIDDINFVDESEFPAIEVGYQPSAINFVHNGHTIQFNYDEGSTLSIDGEVYNLLQFHFHIPSEHTIEGEHFTMEMHLVHANADGDLAVLGVMMAVPEADSGGEPTNALDLIWSELPSEEGEFTLEGEVNAADFLPEEVNILTYQGSLTTPPCSESVTWMISGEEFWVEQQIVDDFGAIFEFNNRPVQPVNERDLTVGG